VEVSASSSGGGTPKGESPTPEGMVYYIDLWLKKGVSNSFITKCLQNHIFGINLQCFWAKNAHFGYNIPKKLGVSYQKVRGKVATKDSL